MAQIQKFLCSFVTKSIAHDNTLLNKTIQVKTKTKTKIRKPETKTKDKA